MFLNISYLSVMFSNLMDMVDEVFDMWKNLWMQVFLLLDLQADTAESLKTTFPEAAKTFQPKGLKFLIADSTENDNAVKVSLLCILYHIINKDCHVTQVKLEKFHLYFLIRQGLNKSYPHFSH